VDRFLQTKRGQINSIVNSILKREKISDYQKRRIMRNASLRRLRNITYKDIKLFTTPWTNLYAIKVISDDVLITGTKSFFLFYSVSQNNVPIAAVFLVWFGLSITLRIA